MGHIEAVLCEGQVLRVGTNGATSIRAFPGKASGNCGRVRWIAVMVGDDVLVRINPEFAAYLVYGEDDDED